MKEQLVKHSIAVLINKNDEKVNGIMIIWNPFKRVKKGKSKPWGMPWTLNHIFFLHACRYVIPFRVYNIIICHNHTIIQNEETEIEKY
jgi:hypothetical protein